MIAKFYFTNHHNSYSIPIEVYEPISVDYILFVKKNILIDPNAVITYLKSYFCSN